MTCSKFDLGIVLGGALSSGAYTAGALDYLLGALDAWTKARERGDAVPNHAVNLKVMTGASAGAMTAALASADLSAGFMPVKNPETEAPNRLFQGTVGDLDLSDFCDHRDLALGREISSLLDTGALQRMAEAQLNVPDPQIPPSFVDQTLELYQVLFNLRGVPYQAPVSQSGHMVNHVEMVHYYFSAIDMLSLEDHGAMRMRWNDGQSLTRLQNTSIAAMSTPLLLSPRLLQQRTNNFQGRKFPIVDRYPDPETGACTRYVNLSPTWQGEGIGPNYEYLATDGGMVRQNVLDLTRKVLTRDRRRGIDLEQDARDADRAVLIIDPHLSTQVETDYHHEESAKLFNVLGDLITAVRHQTDFHVNSLVDLRDGDIGGFLIAPHREGHESQTALASSILGGLGGYLSRDFRLHDFMLGRHNCAQYLAESFVLNIDNPLFDSWRDQPFADKYRIDKQGKTYLPIIPISPDQQTAMPEWPRLSDADLRQIRSLIGQRVRAMGDSFINRQVKGSLNRFFAKQVLGRFVVGKSQEFVMRKIRAVGEKHGLI